jgi:thiamine pyrophosphokinase
MSSHHIVRDNQEPALLVLSDKFNTDLLEQLLEWSPLVMAQGSAVQRLIDLGVKLDVVFCANAELERNKEITQHQGLLEFAVLENEQTLFQVCNELLLEKGHTALNVLGHIDSVTFIMSLQQALDPLQLTYYTYKHKYLLITNTHFSYWMPAGRLFRIQTVGTSSFSVTGAVLSQQEGWYTVIDGGLIHIRVEGKIIFTEPL